VSATAAPGGGPGLAERLGIEPDTIVQEVGYDPDDADEAVRSSVVERSGAALVDEDSDEVVDIVLLWWREDDGDLADALVDAKGPLADNGVVWLLSPKVGRDGHVEPWDVSEAASTAGLSETRTLSVGKDWSGVRLVAPKTGRGRR
jgi:DUF3052 family protein